MTSRFAQPSPLLSLMIGCGLMMTGLFGKAQEIKSDRAQKFQPDIHVTPTIAQNNIDLNELSKDIFVEEKKDQKKYKKSRTKYDSPYSRLSFEIPLACRHSKSEWNTEYGYLPVKFRENGNLGLIANYRIGQGKYVDYQINGGAYANSNYGVSGLLTAQVNAFGFGVEVGAATYEENIRKEYQMIDGQRTIVPHGYGKSRIIPAARLKYGIGITDNVKLIAGYFYHPLDKMHVMTASIGIGFKKKHKQQGHDYHKPAYHADNKQDVLTPVYDTSPLPALQVKNNKVMPILY